METPARVIDKLKHIGHPKPDFELGIWLQLEGPSMTQDSRLDKNPGSSMEHIEGLIRKIESLLDLAARTSAVALVQALMEFHGAGLDRMMEIVSDTGQVGESVFNSFAADQLVSSLLLLYGLHPLPLDARVTQALDKVRPYLDSHGGSVELVEI